MKQVCLLCSRTSSDSNLYCQEIYCPAEMSPMILEYGEWLGDIEILKPVMTLRSATLYEAQHNKQKVLLKVAHPGEQHIKRLEREAKFLSELGKEPHPFLPRLLPPYVNTTIAKDPYGRTMLKDHLLYFYLFEYFPGDTLRDLLVKNPQLWVFHIGWLMVNVATAVAFLQSKELFHYGISPETVLVRFDPNSNIPQVVLCDLGIISDSKSLHSNWYSTFMLPAYTAPELVNNATPLPNYATDVYGLGLILYELLVGHPAYRFKLHSDKDIYAAVQRNPMVRISRTADVDKIAPIALQAVSKNAADRQPSAAALAEQLLKAIGEPPAEQRGWRPSLNATLIIVITLLALAFLITLIINFQEVGKVFS